MHQSLKRHFATAPMRATKAFTITRVSTDDQDQYSPDAQDNRTKQYCERHNLEVVKTFSFTESSTTWDRKIFMNVIKQAEQTAKKLREPIAVVTDKVDRFQRGFKQQALFEKLREEGVLEYHFNNDNCMVYRDSPACDLFKWNMSIALAQNYTDSLRDNVKRAIEQKLRNGEWISQAPIGYLNVRDNSQSSNGRGRAGIEIDPVRAPLVRQLFEKYATGCYSVSQLTKYAREIGLTNSRGNQGPLVRSHVHTMLQEPFYYGVMRVKKTGEEHPHRYETIVSKDLFDKCEFIRTGRGQPHARYGEKEYIFRGMITCAVTGKLLVSDTKRRKHADGRIDEWTYLVGYNADDPSKKVWIREDKVIEQFEASLETLRVGDEEKLKDVLSYIRSTNESMKLHHMQHTQSLKKEHTALENKIAKLMDMRIAGEIDKDEFSNAKKRYKDRQYEITELINAYDKTDDEFCNKLNYIVSYACGAADEFRSSSIAKKRQLIKFVYSNCQMRGKT